MKKSVLLALSMLLPLTLLTGCLPGLATLVPPDTATPVPHMSSGTPEPVALKKVTSTPMPIFVAPFYWSEGVQVYVGEYSEQLKTDNLEQLTALAQEMAQHKDQLKPEQMYVLAIRFYDLGNKDQSVYWFYEAQFREKLFLKSLDGAHIGTKGDTSYDLISEYHKFTKSAGEFINGYAGCDVDNWIKITKVVQGDNPNPPELDKLFPKSVFVDRSQWQKINDDVAAGLGALIEQLSQQKEAIQKVRSQKDLDKRYCN
jgi:hypothetical protein